MNDNISSHFFDLVLDENRKRVFTQLSSLTDGWYLAGGTALALQLGHRISYDFDFFSQHKVQQGFRSRMVQTFGEGLHFTMDSEDQLTFFTQDQVKVTFATTPYQPIEPLVNIASIFLEGINDIAADKAFTVGRRGAFRDYTDLFFLLKDSTTLSKVMADAQRKYGSMFEEKLFLEQLGYMDDITDLDIEFVGEEIPKEEMQKFFHEKVRDHLKDKQAAV